MNQTNDLPRPLGATFQKLLVPPVREEVSQTPPEKPVPLAEYLLTCVHAPTSETSTKYVAKAQTDMRAMLPALRFLTPREASFEGRADVVVRKTEAWGRGFHVDPKIIEATIREFDHPLARSYKYVPRPSPIEPGSLLAEADAKAEADAARTTAGVASEPERVVLRDVVSGRLERKQIHKAARGHVPFPSDGAPHLPEAEEQRVLEGLLRLGWAEHRPLGHGLTKLVVSDAGLRALHGTPAVVASPEPQPASAFDASAVLRVLPEFSTPPGLQDRPSVGEGVFLVNLPGLSERLHPGPAAGVVVEPLSTMFASVKPEHVIRPVHDMSDPGKLPQLLSLIVRLIDAQGTPSDYGPIDASRFRTDVPQAVHALLRDRLWSRWLGATHAPHLNGWVVTSSPYAAAPLAYLVQLCVRGHLVAVDAWVDASIAALEGISLDPNVPPPPRIISSPLRPNKLRPAAPRDDGPAQGAVAIEDVRQRLEDLAVAAACGGPNTWVSAGACVEQTSKSKRGK